MPEPIRKLTAIMFTDIAGFTAMTAVNTDKTVDLLNTQRELLRPIVEGHDGTWLREMGDGLLLIFPTASSAVRAAIAMQEATGPIEGLDLRIGIHMGEVREEAGDIYGDAVNLAARIEPFAASGGVALSDRVQQEIASFPEFTTKYVGRPHLKGTRQKVEIYCLTSHGLPETKLSEVNAKLEKPGGTRWSMAAMLVSIVIVAAYWWLQSADETLTIRNARKITSAVGMENYPTWSPDGRTLAYHSDQSGNRDIWIAQVAGSQPANRTVDHEGYDEFPSWSPDGNQIAFYSDRDGQGIFTMPAVGGIPRRVSLPADRTQYPLSDRPQWSPDGAELAYIVRDSTGNFIEIVTLLTGNFRRMPLPGRTSNRWDLRWSPDGRYVAYMDTPGRASTASQIWVMRMNDGNALLVTDGRNNDRSPDWSKDGRRLFYVSNRAGSMDLWEQKIDDDGAPSDPPEPLTSGIVMRSAVFSPDGMRLAYSRGRRITNIWRIPILPDRLATWADAKQLTFNEAEIEYVSVSPDGARLFLSSDRSGNDDLWSMSVEGGEMRQLTVNPANDWDPILSPDGYQIVFYSSRTGNRDIWVMPVSGGQARQITRYEGLDLRQAWSPDGRMIAFESDRNGADHIWVIPSEGGEARQVTSGPHSDNSPVWTTDGKWLIFSSNRTGLSHQSRLWRIPVSGGESEALTEPDVGPPYLGPDGETLYFHRRDNLWAVSIDGENERVLTDLQGRYGEIGSYPLAADDLHLYFGWRENTGDIWVADVVHE